MHVAPCGGTRLVRNAPASSTQRLVVVGWRASRPVQYGSGRATRRREQQRRAGSGASASSSVDSSTAARLLELVLQRDAREWALPEDRRRFYKKIKRLTAYQWLARIRMLLQQGVTEETVQCLIEEHPVGQHMPSASEGAAVLEVLREHGCSDADIKRLLRLQSMSILWVPASSLSGVFAALGDMLQLSRPEVLRVCLQVPLLLVRDSSTLRQRWAWLQARYGLSTTAAASLARRMVRSHVAYSLLLDSQDIITDKLSGMQREFKLSDAEVSNMFPHLAELLDYRNPQLVMRIRPRWELYQSLLGEFQSADKQRFISDPLLMEIPEPTVKGVFKGVEVLMGSTAAAQSLLRREPKIFHHGVERLVTNLTALWQLCGCSLQQAQQAVLLTPQLAHLKLEAPKFQRRVTALAEWYGHASPAEMLLAPGRGTQLMSSMWKLGARMAFIRRLRLERADPDLNTSHLAHTAEGFCQAIGVAEEEYAAFEHCWQASPEAEELCRHEGRPRARVCRAAGAQQ